MTKFLFPFVLIPLLLINKPAMCNGFDSNRFYSGGYQILPLGDAGSTYGHSVNPYKNSLPNYYELPINQQYMGYSRSSDKLIAPTPALKNKHPMSNELLIPRVSIVNY